MAENTIPTPEKQERKQGRWVKGKSGNPNGRPRKPKAFTELLRKLLAAKREDGRTRMEAIVEQLMAKAEAGEIDAIKYLCDRLDGKPRQAVELSGDEARPLRITYVIGNEGGKG